jgi:lipopolysaccharide biosynthesis regulator YciM
LGQDYYRAGLLDRAENLFEQLITSDRYRVYAYRQLLDIYQQERDWDKAISTAQELEKVSNESMQPVIAQYYCEQAENAKQQNRYEDVFQKVREALKADPRCVRASLLEGHLALVQGDNLTAIQAFKRVEQQDPTYLTEVIEPLQTCYAALEQSEEFIAYLSHIVEKYNDIMPLLKLANLIKEQTGALQAIELIVNRLTKQPSLCGLDYLLDLALTEQHLSQEHLLLLKEMTTQLLQSKPLYQCHQCGFAGKNLHWQCPSCKQWNTTKSLQESY